MTYQFIDEVTVADNTTTTVQFSNLGDYGDAEVLEIRFNVKVDSNYTYGWFYGTMNDILNTGTGMDAYMYTNAVYHLTSGLQPGNTYTNTGYAVNGSYQFGYSSSYYRQISGDGGGSDTMAYNWSPGFIRYYNWNSETETTSTVKFSASIHDDGSSYYQNYGFGWDYGSSSDIYGPSYYGETSMAYDLVDSIELKVNNLSGGVTWNSGSNFQLYGWTRE